MSALYVYRTICRVCGTAGVHASQSVSLRRATAVRPCQSDPPCRGSMITTSEAARVRPIRVMV